MKTNLTILCALLCFAFKTTAQKFTNYTAANTSTTIAGNNVQCIAVDNNGDKWIGTDGGLSKFDGKNWKIYTKKDGFQEGEIYSIAIDINGDKWVATANGLFKFDNIKWTSYDYKDNNALIKIIAIDTVGNKWLGSEKGLTKFNDTTFIKFKLFKNTTLINHAEIVSIEFDSLNHPVLATRKEGIYKWDGKNFKYYYYKWDGSSLSLDNIALGKKGNIWMVGTTYFLIKNFHNILIRQDTSIRLNYFTPYYLGQNCVEIDKDGNAWFGGRYGLLKHNGTIWTQYLPPTDTLGVINSITFDQNGDKWIGTTNGVFWFNGNAWINYSATGLISSKITAMAIDSKDHKWITSISGFSKFDNRVFLNFKNVPNINCIAIDSDNNKWFGAKGIWKYNDTSFIQFKVKLKPNERYSGYERNISEIKSIHFDQFNNKWFSGADDIVFQQSGTLVKFDNKIWTDMSVLSGQGQDGFGKGLFGLGFNTFITSNDGSEWFGSWDGAGRYKDGKFTWYQYENSSNESPANEVKAITIDNNINVWVGFRGGIQVYHDSTFTQYAQVRRTTTILVDKDIIWVGTEGYGVWKFDGKDWTNFTTIDGLSSNNVTSIAVDSRGNKWFGTDLGISKLEESPSATESSNKDLHQIVLGPNPVKTKLYLQNSKTIENYSVATTTGVAVLQGKVMTNDIDMSTLPAGMYFLTLQNAEQSQTFKIIKE